MNAARPKTKFRPVNVAANVIVCEPYELTVLGQQEPNSR